MSRTQTFTRKTLIRSAMELFWQRGYAATSVSQLVAHTGVARDGLYRVGGDKRGLFLACLAEYQSAVVSPALNAVEEPGARLQSIADYLDFQISAAEAIGFPGPGCLMANSMAELAASDADVRRAVAQHHRRLATAFSAVFRTEGAAPALADQLADCLSTCVQGLWSRTRAERDPQAVRQQAHTLINLFQHRLPT